MPPVSSPVLSNKYTVPIDAASAVGELSLILYSSIWDLRTLIWQILRVQKYIQMSACNHVICMAVYDKKNFYKITANETDMVNPIGKMLLFL